MLPIWWVFYSVQWDCVWSIFLFTPWPSHTGALAVGLRHGECKACAVPVLVWFCVLLTSETVVHLYRRNVCGDTYIDTMYCMWRCVHVLAWLNAPKLFLWMTITHKLLKDLSFFPYISCTFSKSPKCHPKQCRSCRTVREETNLCILSVYVCVCLNKVYWGWGSTRGTCNAIPCNSSLALHPWKESRENHHERSGGLGTEMVQGRTHGWHFTRGLSLPPPHPKGILQSRPITSGLTVYLGWDSKCTPVEVWSTEWCVLIATIKHMDNSGQAHKTCLFVSIWITLKQFSVQYTFPSSFTAKNKTCFPSRTEKPQGLCSSVDGPVVSTHFPLEILLESPQSTFSIPGKVGRMGTEGPDCSCNNSH